MVVSDFKSCMFALAERKDLKSLHVNMEPVPENLSLEEPSKSG